MIEIVINVCETVVSLLNLMASVPMTWWKTTTSWLARQNTPTSFADRASKTPLMVMAMWLHRTITTTSRFSTRK